MNMAFGKSLIDNIILQAIFNPNILGSRVIGGYFACLLFFCSFYHRHLYWSHSKKIERINLDGSGRTLLFEDGSYDKIVGLDVSLSGEQNSECLC